MTEEHTLIVQGTVASTAIAFLQTAVLRMIPYAAPGIMLVVLDLIFGIRAAKYRGERVRFSTAIRRTVTKTFTYICFIVLASTLALAFDHIWLEWLVLGLVYANEFASIVGNYLETKGLEISWAYIWNKLIKIGGEKIGVDASDIDVNEAIKPKPKPARDSKGRFVKK